MADYPVVKVTEIEKRPDGSFGPHVTLGAQTPEEFGGEIQLNELLGKFASLAQKFFLLEWEGNKIPRGAVVCGHTIDWTQNGIVSSRGARIGTYERLVEFGGANHREQKMLVFVI